MMLPYGRSQFWKIKRFSFFDIVIRAASILENHVLLYLLYVLQVAKHLYLAGLEHQEYVGLFSFEKCYRMH